MGGQRVRAGAEAGQATAEWVAIVLLVTLALAALAALRPAGGDARLGEALTIRISETAAAAAGTATTATTAATAGAGTGAALRGPGGIGARGAPGGAKLVAAFRTLRAAGRVLVRRAWIVCLGYRRFSYELEHPRLPNQAMPLAEAVDIANGCLNPYAFVTEE
jgi:hypothetical protein